MDLQAAKYASEVNGMGADERTNDALTAIAVHPRLRVFALASLGGEVQQIAPSLKDRDMPSKIVARLKLYFTVACVDTC